MDNNQTIKRTSIPGIVEIQRPTFSDNRGFFRESVRVKELESELGHEFRVAQVNHARSTKNTLRGIHAAPWNKLVYVTRGKVQAVIVDLRKDSETYGQYVSFIIGDDNRSSVFIPAGCGNSYAVLSDDADYTYLTDQEWEPNKEFTIAWDDPDLNIKWELEEQPVLSERDQQSQSFKSLT